MPGLALRALFTCIVSFSYNVVRYFSLHFSMYCKCHWRPPLLFTLGNISSKPQNPLSGEAGTSTDIFCDSCGFLCLLGSCFLSRGVCAHSCNPYVKLLQLPHTHAHSHTRPPAQSICEHFLLHFALRSNPPSLFCHSLWHWFSMEDFASQGYVAMSVLLVVTAGAVLLAPTG